MGNNKIAELSDVCFAYGGTPVLENVNLLINEHDFVGVVGANGSGKTTLLKLLLGHLSPQKGDIRYYCNGQAHLHHFFNKFLVLCFFTLVLDNT